MAGLEEEEEEVSQPRDKWTPTPSSTPNVHAACVMPEAAHERDFNRQTAIPRAHSRQLTRIKLNIKTAC